MGDKLGGLLVTDGGVQLREAEEAYQQPDVPCLKREETVFQGDTSGRGLGYKHTGLGCRLVRDKRQETRATSGRRIKSHVPAVSSQKKGTNKTAGRKGSSCGFANDGANKWSPDGWLHFTAWRVCT
jgi:hypothetical protein